MFEIDITREFSAAHCLRGYQGDCSSLHGHNWTVQAFVKSSTLDEIGIALDFRQLKAELDNILDVFDHTNISEHPDFEEFNPTSEVLAMVIYEKLSEQLNNGCIKVDRIRVCESPGSGATYRAD